MTVVGEGDFNDVLVVFEVWLEVFYICRLRYVVGLHRQCVLSYFLGVVGCLPCVSLPL